MKSNSFLIKVYILVVCTCLSLFSCADDPELSLSSYNIEFDPFPEDTVFIDLISNVRWSISVIQTDRWLSIEPTEGRGNGKLNILADENLDFEFRTAKIVISGDGLRADTIRVLQEPDYDVIGFIRDAIFKEFLLDEFDKNKDNMLSIKEAKAVQILDIRARQISTLEGIEYLSELRSLNCERNLIERLDLSKNVKLRILNCKANNLERLDLTNNLELRELDCSYNSLVQLDIRGLTNLTKLVTFYTDLPQLDVSTNTELTDLSVNGNKLSSIDLSNNKKLMIFDCSENRLTSLDVSQNTDLVSLYCSNNSLTTLNLSSNTKLQHLRCDYNNLSGSNSINISNNVELLQFGCLKNGITNLNLSNNTKLQSLWCDENLLTSLDLTKNTKLNVLRCSNNNLTGSLNLSQIESFRNLQIDIRGNPRLTTIEVPVRPYPDDFCTFVLNNNYISKDATAKWFPDCP